MTKAKKGSSFERDFSKILSLWWTQDLDEPREDVFWRSTTSGARATTRAKKGLNTYGQYGDIAAIDPIGDPLLRFVSIECKRGYSSHSFGSLLDRPKGACANQFKEWIAKAKRCHEASGSVSWILVVRRNRACGLVIMPIELAGVLHLTKSVYPAFRVELEDELLMAVTLDDFLEFVTPDIVKKLLEDHK